MSDAKPCAICGGELGPDITGRLMCYGCGPVDRLPREAKNYHQRVDETARVMFEAEQRMAANVARAMYRVDEWSSPIVPRWSRWQRLCVYLGWRWLSVREWIASRVLRVELLSENERENGW